MTKVHLVATALLFSFLTASAASAQAPDPTDRPGVDLGIRIGYAIPLGKIDGDSGNSLSSVFSGAVPFIFEAGYRFNSAITAGALFQYAIAQVKDSTGCGSSGVSCSASIVRLGLEGLYHIHVGSAFVPWVGLGTGYEWMNLDVSGSGGNGSASAHGFEFVSLQAGGDIRLAPQFGLGPFVSFSIARYTTESGEVNGVTTSGDVTNPAVHEWLQFGVRGVFNL